MKLILPGHGHQLELFLLQLKKQNLKYLKQNFYVPVATLWTQDNTKLFQQLKSGFRRTINWNKYQTDPKTYAQSRYFNHLVNPSFQGENRLFVLSFEHEDDRASDSTYYLPKVEIKDNNVMIKSKKCFDQPINSKLKSYENIRKIATGKEDDYMTSCLLFDSYFKENYKIIAKDLKYYATFKVKKLALLFYQINECLLKAATCIWFWAEEIFSENI